MKKLSLILAASTCALALVQAAEKKTTATGKDQEFLAKAQQINIAEISVGKIAQDKGASDSVKEFGEMLVKHHKKNSSDVESLASSKMITLPGETDAKHKEVEAKLSKLEGAAFDKAFLDAMAKGHKEAIALFQTAAKSSDPEVKAYAEKTLPVLKEHLAMATKGGKTDKKI